MATPGSDELALLRLTLCAGVSNASVLALMERFGSAEEALAAPHEELAQVPGISHRAVRSIRAGPSEETLEKELDLMERHRVALLPFGVEGYPPSLRHLGPDAPVLLRLRGEYRRSDQLAVAVVGARRCSHYGRKMAGRIAGDLAARGFIVVSGMAQGVDAAAHRAALRAGGRTLAVLGCGLAYRLPDAAMALAAEIAEEGAVISELPMETPPRPGNFPPRNRIISGLSLGVVVVEAACRSGSLITARHAGDQGRAVFAVPGPVDSPMSRGSHALIRDGAVLVENAVDVVEGLGPLSQPIELPASGRPGAEGSSIADPRVLALNERERTILDMLVGSPMHIDEVIADTELPASVVSSTLLTLEVRGLIQQLPGQRYVRV
jgi:DNA processing protein